MHHFYDVNVSTRSAPPTTNLYTRSKKYKHHGYINIVTSCSMEIETFLFGSLSIYIISKCWQLGWLIG
jgi:hypothetical protein